MRNLNFGLDWVCSSPLNFWAVWSHWRSREIRNRYTRLWATIQHQTIARHETRYVSIALPFSPSLINRFLVLGENEKTYLSHYLDLSLNLPLRGQARVIHTQARQFVTVLSDAGALDQQHYQLRVVSLSHSQAAYMSTLIPVIASVPLLPLYQCATSCYRSRASC
ncbi:hypothetical protein BD777DRAFT_125709 [Yarrowia lipolytica]|nr:hypothetical protein BD777DRAFT_125709 [Yarrowia lipolytica]